MSEMTTAAPGKLTARQRRAIPLVLSVPTIEAGCERAGIAVATWFSWRAQPAFSDALEVYQSAQWAESLGRMKAAACRITDRLLELVASKDERIALAAIQAALPYSLRMVDALEVQKRIKALEQAAGIKKSR